MGAASKSNRAVRAFALQMLGEIGVLNIQDSRPVMLFNAYGDRVRARVRRLNIVHRARLAEGEVGKTSLYFAHQSSWLDKYAGGRDLIIEIATTSVIVAMHELYVHEWTNATFGQLVEATLQAPEDDIR